MRGEDFAGQDLKNRNFREVDLRNCRFVGCDMRGADMRGANLSFADLTDADLTDANMLGAIMHKTRGAYRNGGPLVSLLGLQYPILIDGKYITFECSTIEHTGRDSISREELLKLDRKAALCFHSVGKELLKWYRGSYGGKQTT